MPSSGTSQNAVTRVPAMLPAVEIAYRRPAVRPAVSTERTARRIAIGETDARRRSRAPKRMIAVTSGLARGPGIPFDHPLEHRLVDDRDEEHEQGAERHRAEQQLRRREAIGERAASQ